MSPASPRTQQWVLNKWNSTVSLTDVTIVYLNKTKPSTTLIYLMICFCFGPEEIAEVRTSARRPTNQWFQIDRHLCGHLSLSYTGWNFLDAFPFDVDRSEGYLPPLAVKCQSVLMPTRDCCIMCIACRQHATSSYHQGEARAFDITSPHLAYPPLTFQQFMPMSQKRLNQTL